MLFVGGRRKNRARSTLPSNPSGWRSARNASSNGRTDTPHLTFVDRIGGTGRDGDFRQTGTESRLEYGGCWCDGMPGRRCPWVRLRRFWSGHSQPLMGRRRLAGCSLNWSLPWLRWRRHPTALPRSENRARLVGIDVGRLAAVRSDVGRAGVPPQTLTLNLFDDVVFWPSSKRAPGQPLDTPCLVGSRGQTAVRSP